MKYNLKIITISITSLFFIISCTTSGLGPLIASKTSVDNRLSKKGGISNSYIIYFYDKNGIHRLNTKTNQDSLLIPLNEYLVQKRISPDKSKIALSYTDNDSSKLVVIDVLSSNIWHIKSIPSDLENTEKFFSFTFEWSPDSRYLGVGYYSEKKSGKVFRLDKGDIFISDLQGKQKRSIGCTASKIFKYWLNNGNIVVSDRNNLYVVDVNNCRTIFTIPIENKREITFSPKGEKMFYFTSTPVYYRNKGRTINVPELYLADYNGKNAEKIIDYSYEPRRPQWSPDGKNIVCDIQSPEWSNVRHICIYDLDLDEASFSTQSEILGIPSCDKPYWSPDGTKLLFDMQFERRNYNSVWWIIETVVNNVLNNESEVIYSGRMDFSDGTSTGSASLGWIDNNNVMLSTYEGINIYNLISKSTLELRSDINLIFVSEVKK